jgi:hypothetical protein
MMSKYDQSTIDQFVQTAYEMFPDTVASTGNISSAEMKSVMKQLNLTAHPSWLTKNKVAWGLYAIAGGRPATAVAVNQPVESVDVRKVVYTTEAEVSAPDVDKNYIAWGNHSDVDKVIKSRIFHPLYITGPTGNGKSTMVEQICAKHKIPLIRVNLNSTDDEDRLIGAKSLVDGNVIVEDGPVVVAMRKGIPILLDEIDAASANFIMCLQGILEGKSLFFKAKNEIVKPAPGFNVIATANTKGKGSDDGRYIGTNILNEAFLERFAICFEQEYPPAKTELKIVTQLMESYSCRDDKFAETLIKWADAIRRTFDDGGIDEVITTRRLVHIVKNFSIYKDQKKAVQLCVNRFDTNTKLAFMDLFEKMSEDPTPVGQESPEIVPDNQVDIQV